MDLIKNDIRKDQPVREGFYEQIGTGEVVAKTIDGIQYNFLIDNCNREAHIVDADLNRRNKIDFTSHPSYQTMVKGEMSSDDWFDTTSDILKFWCLFDYFSDCETYDFDHCQYILVKLYLDKKYMAVIDKAGRIIVPFGLDRGRGCYLDEHNQRILFTSESRCANRFYEEEELSKYGAGADCIYSLDGKKLFPNDNSLYKNLSILEISKSGICLAYGTSSERESNFYIITPDYSIKPFDNEVYEYGYCRDLWMRWEIWDNGLIKLTEYGLRSYLCPSDEKDALVDSQGKLIVKADGIRRDFESGNIIARFSDRNLSCIYDRDGKYMYSIHGKRCYLGKNSPCAFMRIEKCYNDIRYYGLGESTSSKAIVFPIICEEVDLLYDGGPFRVKINGKYGLLDQKGDMAIPPVYDMILCSGKCIYTVSDHTVVEGKKKIVGGRRRIIDIEGKELVAFDFEYIKSVLQGGFVVAKRILDSNTPEQNGLFGVYDETMNIVVPFEYDFIKEDKSCFIVLQSHKQGILNHKGEVLVPVEFDHVFIPRKLERLVRVKVGNTLYFYDTIEKRIDSPALDFDSVGDFENGVAKYKKDEKWGYIDDKYGVLVPHQYDSAGNFDSDGVAEVILDGGKILIDKSGKKIGKCERDCLCEDNIDDRDRYYYDRESFYALTDGQYGEYPETGDVGDEDVNFPFL